MHENNNNNKWNFKRILGLVASVLLLFILVFGTILISFPNLSEEIKDKNLIEGSIDLNTFNTFIKEGKIEKVIVPRGEFLVEVIFKEGEGLDSIPLKEGEKLESKLVKGKRYETLLNPQNEDFIKDLMSKNVNVVIRNTSSTNFNIFNILFLGILLYLMVSMFRNVSRQMNVGISGVKSELSPHDTTVLFEDVVGLGAEKEEIQLVIDNFINPEKYISKGLEPISGILFDGPPGVGKTYMARAIAGESTKLLNNGTVVNFLSYSGADFTEMFVGVGAKRIREMFDKAQKMAPCVVFIDELDAVGRRRSEISSGGHAEGENTLNMLLERLDGVKRTAGVLFVGATNRMDILDKALIRPGRFEKVITLEGPQTKEDREAVVSKYMEGKFFEDSLKVEQIAKLCFGLTPAEIKSLLNDSVHESFRNKREGIVTIDDINSAFGKMFSKGVLQKKHSGEDLKRVALHELGHALMDAHLGKELIKVTIQSYGRVGGYTHSDNSDMRVFSTSEDMRNHIKSLLSGKAVEELYMGDCSIGASNDLERATTLSQSYIGTYGMKEGKLTSTNALLKQGLITNVSDSYLSEIEDLLQSIYKEVIDYFEKPEIKEKIFKLLPLLEEQEVLYSLEV